MKCSSLILLYFLEEFMQRSSLLSMRRLETKFILEEALTTTCLRKFQRRTYQKYLEALVNVLRDAVILMLVHGKVTREIDGLQNHLWNYINRMKKSSLLMMKIDLKRKFRKIHMKLRNWRKKLKIYSEKLPIQKRNSKILVKVLALTYKFLRKNYKESLSNSLSTTMVTYL